MISDRELYRNRPAAQSMAIISDCPAIFDNATENENLSLERCKPRLEPLTK